jgi:thioredoxin-like negative regulator of GroEL
MHAIRLSLLLSTFLTLLACGDPVEKEIDRLIKGDGKEAETARMRLALAKSSAIEPLIAAFQDRSHPSDARVKMAEALFQLYIREKDERILETLTAGMEDQDRAVRLRVVAKLGDLGERKTIGLLIERLGLEADPDVRLEILIALEIMGMKSQMTSSDTQVGTDKLSDSERQQFTELLLAMARDPLPESLHLKVLEWLEIVAEEDSQEARNLELKADLEGAEKALLAARALVPDSKNINHKLGRFYYDNGQREKGLSILSEYGMLLRPARLAQPPAIDGVLEEPVWEDVEPLVSFYQCIFKMRAYPIQGRSEAYVGYRGNVLYIGIKGYESTTNNLAALVTERDQRVHEDDCVELFLDLDHDYTTYYQIVVNSLGTIADNQWDSSVQMSNGNSEWNGEYEIATKVEETFWTAEIAIPIAQFERRIEPGQIWGFNLARIRIANAAEYGQWVPTYGRALRPDRFGFILFD